MSARVLVLTPYPYGTAPGPRSSFELSEPVLAQAAITLDHVVFQTSRLHEIIYQQGRAADKSLAMVDAYARLLLKVHQAGDYDAVLVNRQATPSIAAFARGQSANVREIPSLVDADLYTGWAPRCQGRDTRVSVRWSASHSTGKLAADVARDHCTLQANAERIVAAFRSVLA